jgi:hypothetical protein
MNGDPSVTRGLCGGCRDTEVACIADIGGDFFPQCWLTRIYTVNVTCRAAARKSMKPGRLARLP